MKKITVYTDGACSGNPGPGGWGAVLKFNGNVKELSGGEVASTNNRMEMMAVIKALESLKEPCEVELYTDSEYVKNGITSWIKKWVKNGWMTASKKEVKNRDLWEKIYSLTSEHKINWRWVKGHSGNPDNERCDLLARNEISRIKKS